ncbi:conserved Plasmodium protein, unknown function [Plasmodium berghei]|uniref:Uncharacterized protein n=2 Tax=Plasmodium berghei TaxID=5821 RepID=A0A509AHU2_PLABA|nr:conserved Plasmodium protein, unknown function [Plasmodium berghei ANKA]CXI27236.1 conserved Plasmodium protein, unknown function [Plasmodium berghei]SCM20565.1 conserved Plasmodium protein, unknown function [Plasmodium berghei]SCN24151.1 conserved Plasmodium protein, unknown function [Plasmodium berghei]SCO59420.1 conserved Plasmodium protein, unknown function [Plasmodium berghei]SCO60650.1 conserved Plasmodium protein, unknown function [Plasmodium berghei]|eukprot:XP_034420956.1 conserved Plasmodium protein, unknown function [Plasmodium berghei ANKA]
MNIPWKFSTTRTFTKLFSPTLEIPYFFKNDSEILIKEKKTYPCEEVIKKENEKERGYTIINNIHYMQKFDFYDRLIKTYVDVIFNYPKYPLHVQHLHIFGRNLLKEKVNNVKKSRDHKNMIFEKEQDNSNDLNEYLSELNDRLFYNNKKEKKNYTNYQIDNIISRIKEFYNYKNVIYALFNLEHNKIIFNYTENLLIKDLQHCFVNSNINNNRRIYKYINKNGKDNVYIYILEFSQNLNILKNRFELIKKLFYPYNTKKII